MAVCKVCGKEISGDINGVCEECKAYGLEYSSCYNPDNFEHEEDEFENITDDAYDTLVMTDDASRIVDDLNSNDEKNSDLYNDFKNS